MKKKFILTALLASNLSFSTYAKDWSFEVEPYLMATNIVGDASIGRVSGAPIDVDFKTILDNLDMAAMLHFEAHHKSGWGLAMDYAFMDLGQKKSSSRDGFIKVGLRQGAGQEHENSLAKYDRFKVVGVAIGLHLFCSYSFLKGHF
jgi:hypothetical protein